jgi:N utilization substance protein A
METMAVSANRLELLQIADAVAREKSIDREIVISAMEDAMAEGGARPLRVGNRYPRHDQSQDRRIEAAAPHPCRREVENPDAQMTVEDAKHTLPDAKSAR